MKNISVLALGLLFTVLVTAYSQISFASEEISSACEWGTAAKSGQAAFFQHANYKGTCVIRDVGRYSNAKAIGIGNDKISSVKIGSGTQVSLCNDSNFRGRCQVYTSSMASLGKMNDKTSSAIVGKIRTPPPARKPPGKAPPAKSPSGSTAYSCDEYGVCVCKGETACLSMSAVDGPCATNEHNEPVYACDDVGCACYQSGSAAARANSGNPCDADGFINMNGVIGMNNIVGMNGYTPVCSNNMLLSDTVIGAEAVYLQQGEEEEEDMQPVVSPQQPPPYVFEKDTSPSSQTAPSSGGETYELSAPSGFSIDDVTSTTVSLSWFDNSDREYGVEVYRMDPVESRQRRDMSWEYIGLFQERIDSQVKGTGWRSDEDYDLSPDTNYCYKLRAYSGFDRAEVSDYSNHVCTKTANRPTVKVKRR